MVVSIVPFPIVPMWGCIPTAEQVANAAIADAFTLGVGFVPAILVDNVFQLAYPSYWEKRLAAWHDNMAVLTVEIPETEGVLRVYIGHPSWVIPLSDCRADSGCALGYDTCSIRKGFGSPAG